MNKLISAAVALTLAGCVNITTVIEHSQFTLTNPPLAESKICLYIPPIKPPYPAPINFQQGVRLTHQEIQDALLTYIRDVTEHNREWKKRLDESYQTYKQCLGG